MGGVHASMVASLYPGNVACTPLLAPRSASGAFCHGALRSATSWAPLAAVVDENQKVALGSVTVSALVCQPSLSFVTFLLCIKATVLMTVSIFYLIT